MHSPETKLSSRWTNFNVRSKIFCPLLKLLCDPSDLGYLYVLSLDLLSQGYIPTIPDSLDHGTPYLWPVVLAVHSVFGPSDQWNISFQVHQTSALRNIPFSSVRLVAPSVQLVLSDPRYIHPVSGPSTAVSVNIPSLFNLHCSTCVIRAFRGFVRLGHTGCVRIRSLPEEVRLPNFGLSTPEGNIAIRPGINSGRSPPGAVT